MVVNPRAFPALILVGLLSVLIAACPSGTEIPSVLVSRAPRECPRGIERNDPVPADELPERMRGHLPEWLPEGFGLAKARGESRSESVGGSATWWDDRCRWVVVGFSRAPSPITEGPRVGVWTVEYDKPKACGNYIFGGGRCIGYRASVDGGSLSVQTMGLERDQADRVVRSIPTSGRGKEI